MLVELAQNPFEAPDVVWSMFNLRILLLDSRFFIQAVSPLELQYRNQENFYVAPAGIR
jgi:hypothetical protein